MTVRPKVLQIIRPSEIKCKPIEQQSNRLTNSSHRFSRLVDHRDKDGLFILAADQWIRLC